jgi:signal transduction histidine kinase
VLACNSDGVWNEAGSAIQVRILPHYYETWWFQGALVCGLVGLVFGVARYRFTLKLRRQTERMERRAALERERARIAKDIHDDLGSSLTLIAVLGDLAREQHNPERTEKISSTARQAVKSLDEIVWAVNPRNDSLAQLIDYTGQFAVDYLRAAGVRCLLDVPDQVPPRELPSNVRHDVFLVVKEALQNIVKHARATEVWLRVTVDSPGVRVVISDNGQGFASEPDDALADGLRNMRQRLEGIGGRLQIQSRVGTGTEVRLEFPWPAT